MVFNWERFLNKNNDIAVYCRSKREAEDFCRQMHEHGLTWRDGDSYLDTTEYDDYNTTYSNDGKCGSTGYYTSYGYEILAWADYMMENAVWYNRMVY